MILWPLHFLALPCHHPILLPCALPTPKGTMPLSPGPPQLPKPWSCGQDTPETEFCPHRAAAVMWRTIASSGTTAENVLPTLLHVMEDWPSHSVSTSDGDNADVFALAVSFCKWPLHFPSLPLQQLSTVPHQCISLNQEFGCKSGLGAGSGKQGRVLPLCLPCLSLPHSGPATWTSQN